MANLARFVVAKLEMTLDDILLEQQQVVFWNPESKPSGVYTGPKPQVREGNALSDDVTRSLDPPFHGGGATIKRERVRERA